MLPRTRFDDALFAALQTRAEQLMKRGARLVVFSRPLLPLRTTPAECVFVLRTSASYKMGWGGNVTCFVYEKR